MITIYGLLFCTKHSLLAGAEERFVGAGENTILECEEASHQPGLSSVEWFCSCFFEDGDQDDEYDYEASHQGCFFVGCFSFN